MKRMEILAVAMMAFAVSAFGADEAPLTRAPGGDGWMPLFDGESLDGWRLRHAPDENSRPSWTAVNGVLVNVPPMDPELHGIDLVSETVLGSHELYVEFLVPAGSNSGVYLIGQYEIQVMDSYGKEPSTEQDCGAVYGKAAPMENACRPAGHWQSFHAVFRKPKLENGGAAVPPRITVYQNGVKILENVEIEGVTGAALSGGVVETGPTYLQGNHGMVLYRNIYCKPLED